jgi:hypothetical protein
MGLDWEIGVDPGCGMVGVGPERSTGVAVPPATAGDALVGVLARRVVAVVGVLVAGRVAVGVVLGRVVGVWVASRVAVGVLVAGGVDVGVAVGVVVAVAVTVGVGPGSAALT